eukprot:g3340.t1
MHGHVGTGNLKDWDNAWHLKAADTQDADEVDPEPPHTVVDGSAREMPLRTLAVADEMSYECGVERIYFSATVLFQSRLYRFTVSNPSSIALPYNWRVRERTGLLPYSITPPKGTIAAGASAEFEIRFAPKEEPLRIPLNGSALRPWCHFEVPVSDYRAMRQAEEPLDPKYEIIECESLGTKKKEQATTLSHPFRCLTKRGTILPGKKFEMLFEYLPTDPETYESRWVFSVPAKQASQPFLLVGTVKEPRVGFDVPCIKFKRLLLGAKMTEKVNLINQENLPLNFSFERAAGHPALKLNPKVGVIPPGESFPVEVRFSPNEEKFYNLNDTWQHDTRINYAMSHHMMGMTEKELLDFGEVQAEERRSFTLKLSSPSPPGPRFDDDQLPARYYFVWQMRNSFGRVVLPQSDAPPYLTITPEQGVITQDSETAIIVEYSPMDVHKLDGASLQMRIPSGPEDTGYTLSLFGHSFRPPIEPSQPAEPGPVDEGGVTDSIPRLG